MSFITSTRIRQIGERVEVMQHRQGQASVMLTFSASEAEVLAEALAAKATEARAARRDARLSVQAVE